MMMMMIKMRITKNHVIKIRKEMLSTSIEHLLSVDPLKSLPSLDKRTKIVCTVGPSTSSKEKLRELLFAGMNVMRLNCSHGDHKLFTQTISDLRAVVKDILKEHKVDFKDGSLENVVAIAIDTKGPDIRTGRWLKKNKDDNGLRRIEVGQKIILSPDEEIANAQPDGTIYVNFAHLAKHLTKNDEVFLHDGNIRLVVDSTDVSTGLVFCHSTNSAMLGERKSLNIPGKDVGLPNLKPQDILDLQFARDIGADFVFASFIREAAHVEEIRSIVGKDVHIISKIESARGIQNIDEIIDASDGIMVARGDLGVEIDMERVFLAQKNIVLKCRLKGKPVICATQMLESMVSSPRPTRAECGDVSNAVLEGVDAVMLSGETANGKYPIECVQIMSKICRMAEVLVDHGNLAQAMRNYSGKSRNADDAVIFSSVVAALESNAKAIVLSTEFGKTARIIAKYRPRVPIIAMTSKNSTSRQLQLVRGVQAIHYPHGMPFSEVTNMAMKNIFAMGVAKEGDTIVVLEPSPHGPLPNGIKLLQIPTWICSGDGSDEDPWAAPMPNNQKSKYSEATSAFYNSRPPE